MFECRTCTIRAIRAIAGDAIPARRLALTPRWAERRKASTVATSASPSSGGEPYLNAAQLRHEARQKVDQAGSLVRRHTTKDDPANEKWLAAKEEKRLATTSDRHIRKELEWLKDPAKLADHVHYTLRCEEPEKALELCRTASKDMQCVVSWNHVVDWHMKQGRIKDALNVYNEMKKRAQFPDGFTYTLLLRGLVGVQDKHKKQVVPPEHVSRAVSIYHSMKSPTSRIPPTIIHTNAALKVCAFGRDMDGLWSIASSLPEVGPGAADHITYSIILNALRYEILGAERDDRQPQHVDKNVQEGRKVWMDVVQKWRSGQVKLDEELVCAMGRLLLLSHRILDHDDVLNLVQQTMQIERLIPPVDSEGRNIGHVPRIAAAQDDSVDDPISSATPEEEDGFTETPAGRAFKAVKPLPKDPRNPARPALLQYVRPGADTLNVILDCCSQMRIPKTAAAYWDLFTSETYGVKPDLHNFHAHLRLLMKNRSSGRAAEIVKTDLPKAGILAPMNLTFRLAMDACVRDWKNPHVMQSATKIVDAMESMLADVDVVTLNKYLGLALNSDSGPAVVAAVNRLDSLIQNLRSRVNYGPTISVTRSFDVREKQEILAFFRIVIGAIDTVLNRGLVPRKDYVHWHARRALLHRFVDGATKSVEKSAHKLEADGLRPAGSRGFRGARKMELRDDDGEGMRPQRGERWKRNTASADVALLSFRRGEGGADRKQNERTVKRPFQDSPADFGM
ncbi:hypothetical protein LTR62_004162 [Meristemomyces frigidus]|uniref:Pentatricopeptide repeat protein n=1 Tax=Meristemomyces frigidus TaxID=1508187 RepID=A0AAN7TXJ7_9PEZI|nr:hypothetical protein LTR62_004162 [Meristemomyces frigidus]